MSNYKLVFFRVFYKISLDILSYSFSKLKLSASFSPIICIILYILFFFLYIRTNFIYSFFFLYIRTKLFLLYSSDIYFDHIILLKSLVSDEMPLFSRIFHTLIGMLLLLNCLNVVHHFQRFIYLLFFNLTVAIIVSILFSNVEYVRV